jgi:uncharacterized membrane protein YeaQ/YmgE (transglycosylase-associated protein family)
MLSDRKISKGGIIGALVGLFASLFIHKNTDSRGKKVLKTGSLGILGYLLGSYAEKKINNRK